MLGSTFKYRCYTIKASHCTPTEYLVSNINNLQRVNEQVKFYDLLARLGSRGPDTSYLVQNKQAEYTLELAADDPP